MTNTVYNREDLFGNPQNKMGDIDFDFMARCILGLQEYYCVETGFTKDRKFVVELHCSSNPKLNKIYNLDKNEHKELLGRIAYVASKAV